MNELLNYILEQVAANKLSNSRAKTFIKALQATKKQQRQDIAVIGIACRFSHATSTKEFWKLLVNNENSIRPIPSDRIVLPHEYNLIYPHKGYLEEIDKFDPLFFNISPEEARFMSPAQRLMLETAYSSVEDSGYSTGRLYKTNTGVYIGHDHSMGKDYRHYCIDITDSNPLVSTGSYPGLLSGRISHFFKLSGPSLVVDTACSSGTIAVHLACEDLQSNKCDMAIAGSIFVSAIGFGDTGMSMIMGDDVLLRCFDNQSHGTIMGEGVAALVLKPLKNALTDRDNIYAIIKGSTINNDGATSGSLLTPNAESQEEVILNTWNELGINPEDLSYIEAQSAGTKIGDSIEIMALTNAFQKFTSKKQFCRIGSVKANVGHLVSASGLAAIIKVCLSLKQKLIPATINFNVPNYYINFCDSPVYLNDTNSEWIQENTKPRLAGINSFGFSGTNCHMILEEAPEIDERIESTENIPIIVTISAREKMVLLDIARQYAGFLDDNPKIRFWDFCYTVLTRRGHYRYRLALIVRSANELSVKLKHLADTDLVVTPAQGIFFGEHNIVSRHDFKTESGYITDREKQELCKTACTEAQKLRQDEKNKETVLSTLAGLYVQGADINWEELFFNGIDARIINAPTYPFQRNRYWAGISIPKHKPSTPDENNDLDLTISFKGKDPALLTQTEITVGQIWAKVLGLQTIDVFYSFQNMGGASLIAMKLLPLMNEYFPTAQLLLADVYTYPTVYEMAQFIEQNSSVDKSLLPKTVYVFKSMKSLLEEVSLDASIDWRGKQVASVAFNNIFLTGATGFLGAYLLKALLTQTSARIYCLVRAKDETSAFTRIKQNADKYNLWQEIDYKRIQPVVGDLSKKTFGLTDVKFDTLAKEIDHIVHNGALMNFIFPYSHLKAVNVQGTEEVLKLATTERIKPVHYVSSLYVFYQDRLDRHTMIYENDPVNKFDVPPIGYTQSKLIAEMMLAEARRRNIPVSIYRPVTISGDSRTGACTVDDFLWRFINGCIQLKMYPAMDFSINLFPVDLLSQAIVYLCRKPESLGQAYNFVNQAPISFLDLMNIISGLGYQLQKVDMSDWIHTFHKNESSGNALSTLSPLFEDKDLAYKVYHNHYHNDFTRKALENTGYDCPAVTKELVEKYFAFFQQTGFFPGL